MKKSHVVKLLIIFVISLCNACAKIKPDEIGVRTANFGSAKGIVEKDFDPGYYRFLWPMDTWNRFPRTVQRLSFWRDSTLPQSQTENPIAITSSDGDRVQIGIEVFYRIKDGHAHKVVQDSGIGDRYIRLVRDLAIETTRTIFGQMSTENFYDSHEREKLREEARDYLNERLSHRGFELINFLVVTLEFDPAYENLIKQKKIADQMVALENSKARAAEESGKVELIRQETQVKLRTIQHETDATITQITSETDLRIASVKSEAEQYAIQLGADADLYKKHKEAQSTTLLKNAEADGTLRLNQALMGPGARNLTALEAARNLRFEDIVFPSIGYDWFNPSDMARHLGAEFSTDSTETHPQGMTHSETNP
jgi:Skp family chaperone for outer membrane proteins